MFDAVSRAGWFALLVVVTLSANAIAQDDVERAREAYARGVQLSKEEKWGDALAQFEAAAAARDAPLARFNIAYCQRALARYVAARRTLLRVLANPAGLDSGQLEDAKGYATEFERVIARVDVTLDPPTAALTIDGRPLVADEKSSAYLADVAPAAQGSSLGKATFTVLLDPGPHLVIASREGHQDAVVHPSYRASETAKLDMHLDVLPATIVIKSEPTQGIVTVDGHEVGVAPLEFQRPAGNYKLEVARTGFETYSAALALTPGQRAELTTKLAVYHVPITKRWWFWTGAAAIVVGGVLAAYFIVRSQEPPPPYEGGTTGWTAKNQSYGFGF